MKRADQRASDLRRGENHTQTPCTTSCFSFLARIPKLQLLYTGVILTECFMQFGASIWLLLQNYSGKDVSNAPPHGDDSLVVTIACKQREFAWIVMYMAISLSFFAMDSVWLGSVYEFRGSIASSLILTCYVCYSFFVSSGRNGFFISKKAEIIWAVLTACFQLFGLIMIPFIEQSFGFRAFRQVGANQEMQSMYRTALICESLLKLDTVVAFLLMIMSALFLGTFESTAMVNLAAAIFTIAWTLSLFSAVRREDKCLTRSVFLSSFIQPTYVIYKLIDIKQNPQNYSTSADVEVQGFNEFLAIGCFYVLNRILLLFYSWKTYCNYGKGLRNKVFVRAAATLPHHHDEGYDAVPQFDDR